MFRLGTLGRGAKRVQGTQTWLGTVSTAEGFTRAYVKLLPPNQFVAESVCAWLLSNYGVPTPEPLWVMVHKPVLPKYRSWAKGKEKRICFATKEMPAQSLWQETRRIPVALTKLGKWEHTLPAGIFDELVVNDDREPKNILTDGRSKYWLIDHNHAFGSDQWTPEWLRDNAFPSFSNKLLEVLSEMTPGQRIKFGKDTPTLCASLAKLLKQLPFRDVSDDSRTRNAVNWFLSKRAERLVELAKFRMGWTNWIYNRAHENGTPKT
jgi:hypothetical protein